MSSTWETVALGTLCTQTFDPVLVDPNQSYTNLGVRWYAQGVFEKSAKKGSEIKARRLFRVRPGQFIYNRLFATEGSFALVTPECTHGLVSNEFPVFDVDNERLLPEFLSLYFAQESIWAKVTIECVGTTQSRSRWNEERFSEFPILLPSLLEQRRIVDFFATVDGTIRAASRLADTALHALTHLREAVFSPTENWAESRVGDHLTKIQIPLIVEDWGEYTEIGVRSHGRGVFIKPSTTGASIGKKRVFRLSPGQLVFNIVFAWEGAVAVLGAESEGKIASHRFPTYVSGEESGVEFLAQFFRTCRGLQVLRLCSPGGAGRNKTLSQTALMSTIVRLPAVDTWPESMSMLNAAHEWAAASTATGASLRVLRSAMLTALLSGEHQIPESYDELVGA